jgi:hypothetical protein
MRVRTDINHIDLTAEGCSCKLIGCRPINMNIEAEETKDLEPHRIEINKGKLCGARRFKYGGRQ